MRTSTTVDQTRRDIRETFRKWDIEPGGYEIVWDDQGVERAGRSQPGVTIRYWRGGVQQAVTCQIFPTRAENIRQCYLLLDRLRLAEKNGVQYMGLTSTKDLVVTTPPQVGDDLADAYDILGVSSDDPVELVKAVYLKKAPFYHPDKQGDQEKFKRLQRAYELVCSRRGVKP